MRIPNYYPVLPSKLMPDIYDQKIKATELEPGLYLCQLSFSKYNPYSVYLVDTYTNPKGLILSWCKIPSNNGTPVERGTDTFLKEIYRGRLIQLIN